MPKKKEEIIEAEVIEPGTELSYQLQPAIITANFDEMRERLTELMQPYEGMDAEVVAQMDYQDMKRCRAELNSMSKELNDARKAVKAEYNRPLAEFEAKIKELDALIKAPEELLKAGVEKADANYKEAKLADLEKAYYDFAPALADLVPIEKIVDPRWLNRSVTPKKAESNLCERASQLNADWNTLKKTTLNYPELAERKFFETLSLKDAIDFDAEQRAQQDAIDAMKDEIAPYHEPEPEPEPVAEIKQYVPMFEPEPKYVFTITVPTTQFVNTVNEASALKNHLTLLGIPCQMTRSKEAVNG